MPTVTVEPKKMLVSRSCTKCGKTMKEDQFYMNHDGTRMDMCKKCYTMHIDPFDEETYVYLLEKADYPYVPVEWTNLRDRAYAKDPNKVSGMAIFGKYIAKMKLKQWKQYGWADSQQLVETSDQQYEYRRKLQEDNDALYTQKFLNKEISVKEFKTMVSVEKQREVFAQLDVAGGNTDFLASAADLQPTPAATGRPELIKGTPGQDLSAFEDTSILGDDVINANVAELTDDDKLYLAMKWGRTYKPSEWIELEKKYTEMTQSFDIQDADSINTLILICKTDLKMNQAIDMGDVDGFQKLSKVSESLRKSSKFTAAQNKDGNGDAVNSVGELIQMCERDGFIPRYVTDIPQDKVDYTLKDMNDYVHTLIMQDLGLGQQIEDAIRKIQMQQELNAKDTDEVEDEDYEAFHEEMERQKALDLKNYDKIEEEE